MPKKSRPPRRSAAEWSALLERWTQSGQDLATFAQRHAVSKRSLTWWRWRLRAHAPPLDFVPLVASAAPPRDLGPELGGASHVTCTLHTEGGQRVTVTGPSAFLVDVIAAALARAATRS
jgi:hypothetical protein